MNKKKSMRKSLVLLCVCSILVLISASPIFGKAATAEDDVTAYFAPELTPGSNFTWKVNEWWGMGEWLNSEAGYDPQPGDLWEMKIIGDLPSLSLDGSISSNISEWYDVDFDPSLDIRDHFEYNIAGYDFDDVFGDDADQAQIWRMLHQLFLLPYTVKDVNGVIQNFADFYGASFDDIEGEMDVNTNGGNIKLQGAISDGLYENHSIDLNSSLGLVEEFVYEKKQNDTGITIGIANITLIESVFGPPPAPLIPPIYYVIGGGVVVLGVITVVVVRKVRKPTSQTAPGPRDLGPKTKLDPEPSTDPEPDPEPDPVDDTEPEPEPDPVDDPEPEPEPDPVDDTEPEPEPDPVDDTEPDPEPADDGSGGYTGGVVAPDPDAGPPTPEPGDGDESTPIDDDDKFPFRL